MIDRHRLLYLLANLLLLQRQGIRRNRRQFNIGCFIKARIPPLRMMVGVGVLRNLSKEYGIIDAVALVGFQEVGIPALIAADKVVSEVKDRVTELSLEC
jgi:hypothetical protein